MRGKFRPRTRPNDGMFSGTEPLSGNLSRQSIELCGVVEEMLSDEAAVSILGDVSIADRLEKIAFNALPERFIRSDGKTKYIRTVRNGTALLRQSISSALNERLVQLQQTKN